MKTFEDALAMTKQQRPDGPYQGLHTEVLTSPEFQTMRTVFVRALYDELAQMLPRGADGEEIAACLEKVVWIHFMAGLITGMEMEKQE